ncbi:MAG: GTPase [Methanobacteriota archaeon]|nr:MAG: GTPase [Euryarchaeota archaeon]
MRKNVVIMGAGGRDFHNFNTYFRDNPSFNVVAFTATQIPEIENRVYPRELAGNLYPEGIPILPEEELSEIISSKNVDLVVFSYSDVSHVDVMHKASEAIARGADFIMLGRKSTTLRAKVPVISICAVRTGCGKSPTTRLVTRLLRQKSRRVVIVRHPMPYGDLRKQVCQRFQSFEDLDRYECTIEEREEYEAHIENGAVVYAGVDYEKILREAEKEADIILWDGGNNDLPFYHSDLHIVLVDPHRPGHEVLYHPGEANLRLADLVIVNKVDTAKKDDVDVVISNVKKVNPKAKILKASLEISVDDPDAIQGKRVVVVEDGPTLTHGGMSYGAGTIAAKRCGAKEIVDPRPYAVGSIREVLEEYRHVHNLLPAIGYGGRQIKDLEETINRVPCDLVVIGTPIDIRRVINLDKPTVRVRYELREEDPSVLQEMLERF